MKYGNREIFKLSSPLSSEIFWQGNRDFRVSLTGRVSNCVCGVDSVEELFAVPDEQLRLGRDGAHRVEVDVLLHLARHEVLLRRAARRVHVAHPVAAARVEPIDAVRQPPVLVDLQREVPTPNEGPGLHCSHLFKSFDFKGGGAYPPEKLSVDSVGNSIDGVNSSLKGPEPRPLGDRLCAPYSQLLKIKGKSFVRIAHCF